MVAQVRRMAGTGEGGERGRPKPAKHAIRTGLAPTSCELSRLVGTVPSSAASRSVAELAAAAAAVAAAAFRRAGTLAAPQQSDWCLCGAATVALQLLQPPAARRLPAIAAEADTEAAAMSSRC